MIGVLPWLVPWARRVVSRDFYPALAALVSPASPKHFFLLTKYFFTFCIPITQQPGQGVVPVRLSLNKCFWVAPFLDIP